jgi:hypothetical protein
VAFDDDDLLAWPDVAAWAAKWGGWTGGVFGRWCHSGAGRIFEIRFPIEIVIDQHC